MKKTDQPTLRYNYLNDSSMKERSSLAFIKKDRRLRASTNIVLKKFAQKFGEAYLDILENWPTIIGPILAKTTAVEHLKYIQDRTGHPKGILTLNCPSAAKPTISMQTPQIIHRVNQYFGYCAVSEIRLQSKSTIIPKTPYLKQLQPLDDHQKKKIEDMTNTITNPKLKEALNRLGESILMEGVQKRV